MISIFYFGLVWTLHFEELSKEQIEQLWHAQAVPPTPSILGRLREEASIPFPSQLSLPI